MMPLLQYRIENAYGDSCRYDARLSTDEKFRAVRKMVLLYEIDGNFRKSDSVKLIDNVIYRKFRVFNADEEAFRFWLPKYRIIKYDSKYDRLRLWIREFDREITSRLEDLMCRYERNNLHVDQKDVMITDNDPVMNMHLSFSINWNRVSRHIEMDREGNWKWK